MTLWLPKFATNYKPWNFTYPYQTFSLIAFLTLSDYYELSNAKMLSFQEAGLLTKIRDEYREFITPLEIPNEINAFNKFVNRNAEEYFIFKIGHFSLLFYIYLFCNFVSFAVFFAERTWAKS